MPAPALPPVPASQRRLRIGLGTLIAVEARAATAAAALAAIEAAFAAVTAVDASMHPERAGSDVARINGAAIGERVVVGPATHGLLALARRLSDLTDGVFDPCLPALPGRICDLEIGPTPQEPAHGAWVVCHAPLALDLGGIAKGHAIDRAVETLASAGCSSGLVNAGGDARVFGPRREPFLLRDADGDCLPLTLSDTALAVSTIDARSRPGGHCGYYVRGSARAALRRRFAAVLAPTAVVADALTKCLLLCPESTARHVLAQFGARSVGMPGATATAAGSENR